MKTFEIITLCLVRVVVKNCKTFEDALKKADLLPTKSLALRRCRVHVYNLLTVENGRLSGPMGPVMFAQEVCKALDIRLGGLARVVWDDERTMELIDDEGGYDTVVLLERFGNEDILVMMLDTGIGGIPVGHYCVRARDLHINDSFHQSTEFYKPSDTELRAVFELIASNMALILPKSAKVAA